VLRVCNSFPLCLPNHYITRSLVFHSFVFLCRGIVATTWHSVSSSLLYKARSVRH